MFLPAFILEMGCQTCLNAFIKVASALRDHVQIFAGCVKSFGAGIRSLMVGGKVSSLDAMACF